MRPSAKIVQPTRNGPLGSKAADPRRRAKPRRRAAARKPRISWSFTSNFEGLDAAIFAVWRNLLRFRNMLRVTPAVAAGLSWTVMDWSEIVGAMDKADVRNIRDHRFTDMMWHIGALAAGVILLGGMMIAAYFKIEDKIEVMSNASVRVETKLEDLLQRIPPVATPPIAPARK